MMYNHDSDVWFQVERTNFSFFLLDSLSDALACSIILCLVFHPFLVGDILCFVLADPLPSQVLEHLGQ
jgi:hypothetical protein